MRLTDARYGRDLLRYRLALEMLHFHARSRTIERWTGLSIYRLRTLRGYLADAPELAIMPLRGVSPHQPAVFFRSAKVRTEGALLAGFLHLFKVISPGQQIQNAAEVIPSLTRGLRLCRAYRQFGSLLPATSVSIEYAILLLVELARGVEITLSTCKRCGVMVLVDRLAVGALRCAHCQHELQAGLPRAMVLQAEEVTPSSGSASAEEQTEGGQGSLF
jgi:ribosomal protein L37AE/L43A